MLFGEYAKGALVVDITQHPTGAGHRFSYFTEGLFAERDDPDVKRMIRQFDPEKEIVVVLLKPQDKISTYRVQVQPRATHGQSVPKPGYRARSNAKLADDLTPDPLGQEVSKQEVCQCHARTHFRTGHSALVD